MIAIGVRFSYELLDISLGQFGVMFVPHCSQRSLSPRGDEIMDYTCCFVGLLQYLGRLRHSDQPGYILGDDDVLLNRSAFPLPQN